MMAYRQLYLCVALLVFTLMRKVEGYMPGGLRIELIRFPRV